MEIEFKSSWETSEEQKRNRLQVITLAGDSGGLFRIDQEVVTLRGLYGYSGLLTDLRLAE